MSCIVYSLSDIIIITDYSGRLGLNNLVINHAEHVIYHARLALGDRFGLFIRTLNNAERLFIQIIHSIEKKELSPT